VIPQGTSLFGDTCNLPSSLRFSFALWQGNRINRSIAVHFVLIGSPGRARTADPVINRGVRTLFLENTFCDFPRDLVVWSCAQFTIIPAFCLRTMAREWHEWIDCSLTVPPRSICFMCFEHARIYHIRIRPGSYFEICVSASLVIKPYTAASESNRQPTVLLRASPSSIIMGYSE
jgi:hypothetical protein